MDTTDYLYTCAEIGVALAGFSALVVALSQRAGAASSDTHYWYMSVIIERGLMASFLAMLPSLLEGLGVATRGIWLISSGLFVE